jgi:hypothetical protein
MAIVARECNVTNFMPANPIFSSLIITNHLVRATPLHPRST